MDPVFLVTGLVVGVLVGLTGVGGGAVMTPALVIYGVPPAVAVGTDLIYAAITKSAGAVLHHLRGNIKWPVVWNLSIGSLPCSVATLWLLDRMSDRGVDFTGVITVLLGVALMLTAVIVLTRPLLQRLPGPSSRQRRAAGTILVGSVLGVLVTATSVGAGALGAAMLLVLYRNLAAAEVVGTDLAHAVLLAGVAGIGHMNIGTVEWGMLLPLLSGSLPGVYVGTRLSDVLPGQFLTRLMALVLLALGLGFSVGAVAWCG
jgi:uncharacterized membrane protein YfcA